MSRAPDAAFGQESRFIVVAHRLHFIVAVPLSFIEAGRPKKIKHSPGKKDETPLGHPTVPARVFFWKSQLQIFQGHGPALMIKGKNKASGNFCQNEQILATEAWNRFLHYFDRQPF
jgi:hypothetical protein